MNEIVFITYIISLIALAAAIYAIIELRELRKFLENKRTSKPTTTQIKRPKGHWD